MEATGGCRAKEALGAVARDVSSLGAEANRGSVQVSPEIAR